MSTAATLFWFASHDLRLAWRDFAAMMTAGRRRRAWVVGIVLAVVAGAMHFIAYLILAPYAEAGVDPDKATLVAVTGTMLLSLFLMLSQAMESVTRVFYARDDLDLILSSPVEARQVFAVRIAALGLSVTMLGLVIAAPFINMLAVIGGARWLAAYGVVAAGGLLSASLAVVLTVALFRLVGPRRTRLLAQIVAAVIGAAFVIGLQVAAILSSGTLSRTAMFNSAAVISRAPEFGSLIWLPALAVLGDWRAMIETLGASILIFAWVVAGYSPRFAERIIIASGAARTHAQQRAIYRFHGGSAMQALRRKEWMLLRRDPWLLSQTLMQLLYLLPPALLLWRSFAGEGGTLTILVPVLVMAAGQLAGGLAWIAISGEDAPDLIATAPVSPRAVLRAKIEAVLAIIALVFAPFVIALGVSSLPEGLVATCGIIVSAASATGIQIWFRTQAKRSQFRRRQVSSRIATLAEAFVTITWAAAAGLAAADSWFALVPGFIAVSIVLGVWAMAPRAAR